jgi:hypothetical protein
LRFGAGVRLRGRSERAYPQGRGFRRNVGGRNASVSRGIHLRAVHVSGGLSRRSVALDGFDAQAVDSMSMAIEH